MTHVFISYNRKDGKYAKAVRDQLAARGMEVFLDIDSIAPSQQFPQATADAIAHCDLFLLLWSRNAAQSKFVTDEWNIALAQKKAIFPVLLEADFFLPAALSATNAWPAVSPAKLANRVVRLLVGEHNKTRLEIPAKSKRFRVLWIWGVGFAIVIFLSVRLLPSAITWDAQSTWTIPTYTDTLQADLNEEIQVHNPLPLPSTQRTLNGNIFDAENTIGLAGIRVCAICKINGMEATDPICTITNGRGHFQLGIKAIKIDKIELEIDGSAVGYEKRIIAMDPKTNIQERQLSLKKL